MLSDSRDCERLLSFACSGSSVNLITRHYHTANLRHLSSEIFFTLPLDRVPFDCQPANASNRPLKTVRNDFYKIQNRSHPLLYVFASTSVENRRFDAFHSHRLLKLTFSAGMERSEMKARPY
jgi:hypothetical protein